jgi:hypothetical protein
MYINATDGIIGAMLSLCSSSNQRVKLSALAVMTDLFEDFHVSKNPFAPLLWQKILITYLQVYTK